MKKQLIGLGVAALLFCGFTNASAEILRLSFDVDVDQFWTGVNEYIDPGIALQYDIFVDTTNPASFNGTFPDSIYSHTNFDPALPAPETPFTAEVKSQISGTLQYSTSFSMIGREFSETGFDNLGPETFE